jgi:predicted Zn-dependent peptidase
MAELKPLLDRHFGQWRADPAVAPGSRSFKPVAPPAGPRIILVDRPGSPQSHIRGGVVLPMTGRDDNLALGLANDILGGLSTSRLNMDIRETKNWAYGVASGFSDGEGQLASFIVAPVQTDRTGDALAAMIADVRALLAGQPITAAERDKAVANATLSLPGDFERGAALLGAMERNATLGRPDDYYARLADRLRALSADDLNTAAKALSVDRFTWIIVGDRKAVEPQLTRLGIPVEVRPVEVR